MMHVRPPSTQRGAALVIVLILLLVMTIMGLVSTRVAGLQERMGATLYDRSLAFQAAEAALRQAETLVGTATTLNIPTTRSTCNNEGLCGFPDPQATPIWRVGSNWNIAPTVSNLQPTGGPAVDARYLIELLADEVPVEPAPSSASPPPPPPPT